jgi:hypothetical protein
MRAPKILIAGLACVPLSGFAVEDLSNTWLELDWANQDIDEFTGLDDIDDGDGWAVRGSFGFDQTPFEFFDRWYIFADWIETDADVTFFDLGLLREDTSDVTRFNLGAGFTTELNEMSELVFQIAYSDIDFEDFDSDDGFFLDGSWRGQVSEMIELSAGLRYTDIGELENFSVIGNALFEVNSNWGINVAADIGDELTTYGVGVRYSF